ncbi:hypothetical protein HYV85_02895 [Candidatus Woesearchaeota archaeon]|nr:hypothetical protein [Candidatus Woesearchaeota archaeon]
MDLASFKLIRAVRDNKAQYLTIDAFIASMIVAVALVIVLAAKSAQPYTTQSELVSRGFTESLSSLKLSELNNPLVINMAKNGTINNLDNTVLQQASEFYFTVRRHYAFELVKNVTYRLIPPQYSFKLLINNDLIYEKAVSNENTSAVLVSSKKLVFGVVNRTALVYGPTIAEIRVWQ